MNALSNQDLYLLRKLQLSRLRRLRRRSLSNCYLEFKSNTLVVHCPDPGAVDRLMTELDLLLRDAWIVTGAKYASICYVGEEIYHSTTLTKISANSLG